MKERIIRDWNSLATTPKKSSKRRSKKNSDEDDIVEADKDLDVSH